MPIYTYVCANGHQFDRFLKLKDYREPQTCDCGAASEKKIMPTMLNCDMKPWESYESPVSGRPITSYRERNKDMKDHGCVDYEPSMRKHVTKHMETEDTNLEKKMDDFVEKTIAEMPVRKREKLESELDSGANISYERI